MIHTEMAYVVCNILPFVITYASSSYIEGYWSINTSLSGRYTAADQLFETNANTALHCAAFCQVHAQCISFFLNPTNSQCFGNKNPFIDHAITSTAIGYMYYKKDLTSCEQNGYTYNVFTGTCFKYIENKVGFDQAKQNCAQSAGQSIRPSNALRQNAVASFLRTKSPDYCIWTEGNDREIEGRYVWGNSIAITEPNWKPGEPLPGGTAPNDCITMWPLVDYKWDDINCAHGCYVLCELVP